MTKEEMLNEVRNNLKKLTPEQKEEVLAYLYIRDGETPTNPLAVLRLNRMTIKAQKEGAITEWLNDCNTEKES